MSKYKVLDDVQYIPLGRPTRMNYTITGDENINSNQTIPNLIISLLEKKTLLSNRPSAKLWECFEGTILQYMKENVLRNDFIDLLPCIDKFAIFRHDMDIIMSKIDTVVTDSADVEYVKCIASLWGIIVPQLNSRVLETFDGEKSKLNTSFIGDLVREATKNFSFS